MARRPRKKHVEEDDEDRPKKRRRDKDVDHEEGQTANETESEPDEDATYLQQGSQKSSRNNRESSQRSRASPCSQSRSRSHSRSNSPSNRSRLSLGSLQDRREHTVPEERNYLTGYEDPSYRSTQRYSHASLPRDRDNCSTPVAMTPEEQRKYDATLKRARDAESRAAKLNAQLTFTQAKEGGLKRRRTDDPETQIQISQQAKSILASKKGKSKNGEKSLLGSSKKKISESIKNAAFALFKFIKGPGTAKKVMSCIVGEIYGKKMDAKTRAEWFAEFEDVVCQELNKHRSTVQTAIKDALQQLFDPSVDESLGTVDDWEDCLDRSIDLTKPEEVKRYQHYYNVIMAKATGATFLWNERHRGYFTICEGKAPRAKLNYVTPETEAYTLLIIRGNLVRWHAQFQVAHKYKGYKQMVVTRAVTAEDITMDEAVRWNIYKAKHSLLPGAAKPAGWMATNYLPFEAQGRGTVHLSCVNVKGVDMKHAYLRGAEFVNLYAEQSKGKKKYTGLKDEGDLKFNDYLERSESARRNPEKRKLERDLLDLFRQQAGLQCATYELEQVRLTAPPAQEGLAKDTEEEANFDDTEYFDNYDGPLFGDATFSDVDDEEFNPKGYPV